MDEVVVLPSAHKHDITRVDMFHALRNAVYTITRDNNSRMIIGPDLAGNMIEVGVTVARDFDGLVIFHAMKATTQHLPRKR